MATEAVPEAEAAEALRAAWRDYQTPFYRTSAALIVVLFAAEVVLARTLRFSGINEIVNSWPSVLLGLAFVGYVRWRPLPRAVAFAELAVLAVIFSNLLSILIQIAGRSPHPLFDAQLAALDHAAHFSTAYWVVLVARCAPLRVGFFIAYDLLPVMLFAATILPSFLHDARTSRRFVLGVMVAGIVTAALFWMWPAAGPWTVEGYPPTPYQAAVANYLMRLRSPFPVSADMDHAGIVSFPSFHVVLAVLSAFALRRIRVVRVFAWVLCALVCIATITTGWHYGVDVLGGMAVAIATIAAVSWVE